MKDNPFNRLPPGDGEFVVVCSQPNTDRIELASGSSSWATEEDARRYAATINPCWNPRVFRLVRDVMEDE